MQSIVGKLSVSLISNEKLETKFEDSELPPPIPPKRLDVNHCISGRGYDQCNSCTAHEPKVFLPPPPVPLPLADSLPVLPPKTRYDYIIIINIITVTVIAKNMFTALHAGWVSILMLTKLFQQDHPSHTCSLQTYI